MEFEEFKKELMAHNKRMNEFIRCSLMRGASPFDILIDEGYPIKVVDSKEHLTRDALYALAQDNRRAIIITKFELSKPYPEIESLLLIRHPFWTLLDCWNDFTTFLALPMDKFSSRAAYWMLSHKQNLYSVVGNDTYEEGL